MDWEGEDWTVGDCEEEFTEVETCSECDKKSPFAYFRPDWGAILCDECTYAKELTKTL